MTSARPLLALGLMSGTSIDGAVSAAIIRTDGAGFVERLAHLDHVYEPPDGRRPFHHLAKAAELAVRRANGELTLAARLFPDSIQRYLETSFGLTGAAAETRLSELTIELRREAGLSPKDDPVDLDELIRYSTAVHGDAASELLRRFPLSKEDVAYVGYHGQTLFHAPFAGITVQVGHPQALADRLGIPVIFDFRRADVAAGGQGAPLAPVYHRALARAAGIVDVAVLNLGGSANVTMIGEHDDELLAFDTGPANGLIDRFVSVRTHEAYDCDSRYALAGRVNDSALRALVEKSIILADGRNYLDIPPPKSIDIRDYTFELPELASLSLEDGCATLNAFSAECVARSVEWCSRFGMHAPERWFLAGGGAKSPHLRAEITARLASRIGHAVRVESAEAVGWSASAMEAELFAYLAVRSANGLPLSYPTTTGVPFPTAGGTRYVPLTR